MPAVVCLDVGSTYTKGVLVDLETGRPLAHAAHPTTVASDVMDGVDAVRRELELTAQSSQTLACSSAGGGLRLAVVGYEREVTAEAGRRVGLSAGAKVVHVASGPLDGAGMASLQASTPDLVLLVGGTDGGNAETLRHNAHALAAVSLAVTDVPPVVLAGNVAVQKEVSDQLTTAGVSVVVADNILPSIGVIAPESARAAIREVFLSHVIGGKALSQGRGFAELVRAPTPDAVLSGVEVLAEVIGGDVLVVDIGGATTDVYSVIAPQGEDAGIARDVVAPLWQARTVEADLGMRWNAEGIVEAAARERIPLSRKAQEYAASVQANTAHVAHSGEEWALEQQLASAAALIAVRRHGRPLSPSERPRPLSEVVALIGSGGVLRHSLASVGEQVLHVVATDHAGGWRVPTRAHLAVDTAYLLFAVGLLARDSPTVARRLAHALVGDLRRGR